MRLLEQLAEQRIAEALARGELSDLPGAGRPLDLDDDALVPEELRAAYRILRNAGYLPDAINARVELARLVDLHEAACDDQERVALSARMSALMARLGERSGVLQHAVYGRAVASRLAGAHASPGCARQSEEEPEPPSGCFGE